MKFEVLKKWGWTSLWHAHASGPNDYDWDKLREEARRWLGPVRMIDAAGLVVREFHP